MALSEFEVKQVEKAGAAFLNRCRPPVHIRKQLDFGWRLDNQSVYIYETRPVWNRPSEYQSLDIAKTTFVRTQGKWKIFWMRQDLKWHGYEPQLYVGSIDAFFSVVEQDQHACFFG